MAYSKVQRKKLLAVTAAHRRALILRAKNYMSRTGLTCLDLAERIGYARPTLNFFLNGRYHVISGDDSAICAALEGYMDRNPIEATDAAKGTLYETENVRLIRHCFNRALEQRCAYYFRGAPGCQKTFVLKHLVAQLNLKSATTKDRRAYLVRSRKNIRPCDLMKRIARKVGSQTEGNIDRVMLNLQHELRGCLSLLVFDEAQFLSIDCLETIRELLDDAEIGLLFAGSHELEDTFERLDMAQWRSRIRKGTGLPGLSEAEAQHILRTELPGISARSMADIIGKSHEIDDYRGEKLSYISARLLFLGIEEIKLRKQEASGKVNGSAVAQVLHTHNASEVTQ